MTRPIVVLPALAVLILMISAGMLALLVSYRLATVATPWSSADTYGSVVCGGMIGAFVFFVVGAIAASVASKGAPL